MTGHEVFFVRSDDRSAARRQSQDQSPIGCDTHLQSSRRLLELEFLAGQLGSLVAMTQRRVVWTNCLEGLELSCVADLPLVKSPAHQSKRQFALAFGCREPTCRLSRGKPRA